MKHLGLLLVISAPSGTGKSTICRELMKAFPDLFYSVSVTTRAPRAGEKEGKDYRFVDPKAFQSMVDKGAFLEHAEVFGQRYGTPKKPIEDALAGGKDALLDIDVQGMLKIRKHPQGVFILLLPPSMQELESRLTQRRTEDAAQVQARVQTAREEIGHAHEYDYVICNDDLKETLTAIQGVMQAERYRPKRNRKALKAVGYSI